MDGPGGVINPYQAQEKSISAVLTPYSSVSGKLGDKNYKAMAGVEVYLLTELKLNGRQTAGGFRSVPAVQRVSIFLRE